LQVKLPKVQEDFFDSLMKELAAGVGIVAHGVVQK
jgi:hypothetical protein